MPQTAEAFLEERQSAEDFLKEAPSAEDFLSDRATIASMADATRATVGVVGRAISALDFVAAHSPGDGDSYEQQLSDSGLTAEQADEAKKQAEGIWVWERGEQKWYPSKEASNAAFAGQMETAQHNAARIESPLVTLPRAEVGMFGPSQANVPGTVKVAAGAYNAAKTLPEFFTTPLGVSLLASGNLPAIAQRLIAGGFAVDMALHTPEQIMALAKAVQSGNTQDIGETATALGMNVVLTGLTARHALTKVAPLTAEAVAKTESLGGKGGVATGDVVVVGTPTPLTEQAAAASQAIKASQTPLTAAAVESVKAKEPVIEPPTPTPAAAANESGTIIPEATGVKPPATPPLPQDAPLAKPKGARGISGLTRLNAETELVGTDILDFLANTMPVMSRTAARQRWGKEKYEANKSLWDDAPGRLDAVHHNAIFGIKGSGKTGPDVAAQAAFDAGILSEPSAGALWEAVKASSKARVGMAKRVKSDIKFLDQQAEAQSKWEQAVDKGKLEITSEDLAPGDVIDVEGEMVKVKSRDPESGDLILEDGTKFGTQVLAEGKKIYVEKFDPQGEEVIDFLPSETPKLRPGEKGTGDLLQSEKAPFNLAGEKGIDTDRVAQENTYAERHAAEAKAAADKGQTTMFGINTGALGESGMGGAKPGEFATGQGNPTAMKYRKIDAERQERGLEPLVKGASVSDQVVLDRAMAAIDADPSLPDRLVKELNDSPRAIEDWENHVLLLRKIELKRNYERTAREAAQAFEDGRLEEMELANAQTADFSSKLTELETASRLSGSRRGAALRALRVMANEDMTLASLEMTARADRGGAPITPEERLALQKIADDYKAKADAEEAHRVSAEARIATLEIEKAMAEAKAATTQYEPRVLQAAEKFAKFMDKKGEDALARIKARLGRTSAGIDPTILSDVGILGAAKITRGAVDFAKWTDAMVRDLGEWFREHAQEGWDTAQAIFTKENDSFHKGVDKSTKEKIKRATDIPGRIADTTEAIRTKAGAEGSPLHGEVRKLVRLLVEQDPTITRDALIDAVHGILKESIPEITRLEAMDAISGRGRFWTPDQGEISKTVRDLSTQIRLVGHQIDVEAGRPLPRTGYQPEKLSDAARHEQQVLNELKRRHGVVVTDPAAQLGSVLNARKTYYTHRISDLQAEISSRERIVKNRSLPPTDPALEALKADYARVKAEHDEIFPRQPLSDAQRLERAIAAAERNEKAANDQLTRAEKGDFTKPAGSPLPESATLNEIRARTAALREETKLLKDLANPKKTPDQIALQTLKTRLTNRIAELKERTAKGDFSKKPRREVIPDAELNRLQAEKEQVVVEYQRAREKKLWQDMTVLQKTGRVAANTYDAARTLLTTGEFSFILRQGKFNVLSHPLRSAQAIPKAIRAMRNEKTARAIDLEIFNHPEFAKSKADKLAITDENAPLTKQEEIIAGRWSHVIPVVSAFNRAARVFLNKIRFDTWLAMRRFRERGGNVTPEAGKAIATYVNESTGRGSLGKAGDQAAPILGRMLFAPHYLASRFQYAIGHSLWKKSDLRTKAVIASEYARTLIGLGIYYGLLNLWFNRDDKAKIGTDLRSTDFGKLKKGDTRLDPLAGLAQIATFGARTVTGQKMNARGKVDPIRGKVPYSKDNWRDLASQFAWSKAHPVPATIADLFSGTDLVGNVVTPEGEAMDLAWPLTYKDVYQALKAQDLDDATAMALLAFLGEGLNTYQPKKK